MNFMDIYIKKLKILLGLWVLCFPSFLLGQQYQADIVHKYIYSKTGDTLELTLKYYSLGGSASLGFANFSVGVTPLGAADFANASIVYPGAYGGVYFWEQAPDYAPLNLGGTNFINVTVVPTLCAGCLGQPINSPIYDGIVAVVKIPLNASFCGDSVKIFWRIDPDALGGAGVILDYSGNDIKSVTNYSDTLKTKLCYTFPTTPPTITVSNSSPCVGDTVLFKLDYGTTTDYLWDSVFFYVNGILITASAADSFVYPVPSEDTIKVSAITSFHCDCANDTLDTLIVIPKKQLQLLKPFTGFYQVCQGATTDSIIISSAGVSVTETAYNGGGTFNTLVTDSIYKYTTNILDDTVTLAFIGNACPNDSVVVNVYVSDSAKGNLAKPIDTLCVGNTITLDANIVSGDSIKWYDPTGGTFFPTDSLPKADYTPSVLTDTIITISYLISGGACPDTMLNKQLVIKEAPAFVFPPINPTTICAGAATDPLGVTILSGTDGFWTCSNCSGYFSDTTHPNAQYVSVAADGGKNLEIIWNMAAPSCDTLRDTQYVSVISASGIGNFNQTLPDICVGDTSVLISATPPTNPNFQYYWETSGAGQILNNSLNPCPGNCSGVNPIYYASVPADAGDTIAITFVVHDITLTCDTSRFIEYLVVNDSARGHAFPDTSIICFPGNSDTLRGTFVSGIAKYWNENGAGAFNYINDSTVVYLPAVSDQSNTVDAVWNIESGACPPHRDTVKVIVSAPPNASIVYLGANSNLCRGSTSDTLVGSPPPPGGTGRWETPDGFGTFSNPTGDSTTYTSSASDPASVTIYWILENLGCDPDTAVFIFNTTSPSAVSGTFDLATLGRDTVCVSNDYPLIATVSGANANPYWDCSGCVGTINPNTTTVTGAYYTPSFADPDSVTIRLVIEDGSGACNPTILEGVLYIGKQPQGKPIYVPPGSDSLCVGDTAFSLVGDTLFGTGYWDCIGCNGTFSDPTNDTTDYYSVPADAVGDTTILQILWITQLPPSEPIQVCPADTQKFNLPVFKVPVGTFVLAPDNDTICVGDTTAPLGAFSTIGAGHWECPNCNGGLTFNFTGNSNYIPVIADTSQFLQLTWVTENGVCPADRDTSLLYVSPPPAGNIAGFIPNPVCQGQPVLLEGAASSGQGFWYVATPSGYVPPMGPVYAPTSWFVPDSATAYIIVWNITSPGCDTLQYFQYTIAQDTPYADLTRLPDTACAGGDILLSGVVDIYGNLDTFYVSPVGTITQDNKGNYYISTTLGDLGTTIYFTVIVSNAVCAPDTFVDSIYLGTSPFTLAFRDTSICKGESVVLEASGAVTYSWVPKNSLYIDNPSSPTPTVHPPVSTVFKVTMTNDTIGCALTDSVNVTVNPLPVVTISPGDTTICAGDTLLLTASGAHEYEWRGTQWFSDTFATQTYVSTRTATVYRVIGTDTLTGCSETAVRLINTVPAPTVFFDIRDMCTGQSVVVSTQQDSGCVNKYWFNAPYGIVRNIPPPYTNSPYFITSQDTFTFNATTPGTFSYTAMCVSANNCKAIYQDTVKVYPQPVADFSATPLEVSLLNPRVTFTNLSTGATQFLWNFGDINSGALNTDTARNPVHVFTNTGEFTIALSVTNEIGCTDLEIKPAYISVIGEQYYFPTAFTPNGDGKNDFFRPLPLSSDPDIVTFEIYDRWGKLVFQTTSRNGWDGNDANGRPFAPGAYSYKCIIQFSNGTRQVYTGRVTLIR